MIFSTSASFTRPADVLVYAANDLVANSTTAGSVVPLKFVLPVGSGNSIDFRQVSVSKTGTAAANANFHLRLYSSSPTCANGDNGAWSTNISGYLGKIDPAIMEAFTDGCANVSSVALGSDIDINSGTSNVIYGLLVADAAYTPASAETFTVTLYGEIK